MKHLLLATLTLISGLAHATQEGQITMSAPAAQTSSGMKMNLTEVGLTYSSISNGMSFASVGVIHEYENGFSLGARGLMPLQFTDNSQIYMGQVVGRFMILNEANQIYVDTTLGLAYANQKDEGASFGVGGLAVGYLHQIQRDLKVGASLGADYSYRRIEDGTVVTTGGTLNNRLGINGTYAF